MSGGVKLIYDYFGNETKDVGVCGVRKIIQIAFYSASSLWGLFERLALPSHERFMLTVHTVRWITMCTPSFSRVNHKFNSIKGNYYFKLVSRVWISPYTIARNVIHFLDIFCLCTKTDHKPTNCILWLLEKLWNFKDCLTVL